LTHPYSHHANTGLWRAVAQALTELQGNRDITITTADEYVIGFLCQALSPQPADPSQALGLEARRLTRMLTGKVIHRAWRHRANELGLQFTDGTQFFADRIAAGLAFSVVDGPKPVQRPRRGTTSPAPKGSVKAKPSRGRSK
jgi:hypothetical protein